MNHQTMRMASAATLVLLVALTMAAAARPAAAAEPSKAEAASIQAVVNAFMEALDTANIEKFSALFAPDATAFFPLPPLYTRLENKDQITKVFTVFFDSVRKGKTGPRYMNLVPKGQKVQLYGGTAVVTFHFEAPDLIARRTLVLTREGGKWLIVHMHA
ncbi:MAG TPA: nuclear transport factor 2 family protein, partial [Thermoanaerobaculaceae bacterium]|nr:nuclear transport factor 2 family protein [Thermoanaerobaculaceae bacterium]